jgi:hypothetical protein
MTTTPNPTDKSDPVFVEVVEAMCEAHWEAGCHGSDYWSWRNQSEMTKATARQNMRAALSKLTPEYLIELSGIAERLEAAEKALIDYHVAGVCLGMAQASSEATKEEIASAQDDFDEADAVICGLGHNLFEASAALSPKEKKT